MKTQTWLPHWKFWTFFSVNMDSQFSMGLQESSSATDWRKAMPQGPPFTSSKLLSRKHSADKVGLNDLRGLEIEASTSIMPLQVKPAIVDNSPKITEVIVVFLFAKHKSLRNT